MTISKCEECLSNYTKVQQNQKYCSIPCRDKVYYREKKSKKIQQVLNYVGKLKCVRCGYTKDKLNYFDFHHRDRKTKEDGVMTIVLNNSWEQAKLEIDKCDLLCPTCHREVHIESSGRSNR